MKCPPELPQNTYTPRPVTNISRSNSCSIVLLTFATRHNGQRVGICLELPAGEQKNWGSIYGRGKKVFSFRNIQTDSESFPVSYPNPFSYFIIVRREFGKRAEYLVRAVSI
jgi:hypothetical protein